MTSPNKPIELTDYQKMMLGSIDTMMNMYDEIRTRFDLPARRRGKSVSTNTTNAASKLCGNEITSVIINEWHSTRTLKGACPEAVFDNPLWPGSRFEVWRKEIDRRDPRNPNPKAGRIMRYEVKGDRMGIAEEFSSLPVATMRAQELHQRFVRKAIAQARAKNPNFGRF